MALIRLFLVPVSMTAASGNIMILPLAVVKSRFYHSLEENARSVRGFSEFFQNFLGLPQPH